MAKRSRAVYRLDNADLERILPLSISPKPKSIQRIAIVIAHNVDPTLPQQIEGLIAQLGDPEWSKREEASQLLLQIGPSAEPKLREAMRGTDTEVAIRAERLIAQIRH